MVRAIRTCSLTLALFVLSATPAFAHVNHTHADDDVDYADPVLFDDDIITDCSVIGQDMILWELTGSSEVTYAELHIDEPEDSVTTRSAAPYIWVTLRYDLAAVDADADRIVGDIADDVRLTATICDAKQTNATGLIATVIGVGAAGGIGFYAGRKTGQKPPVS